ncbi:MAG: hypothetical protein WCK01_00685 [Candidatus Uhrbacteria bacterium]
MQTFRPRRPGTVHISAPSFPVGARPSVYRKIAYTFIGLTVIVILGVLWLTSVRADVAVKLRQESVRLDGVVEVARAPRTGQIPGRTVKGSYTKTREFSVLGQAGAPVDPRASSTTPVVVTPEPAPTPTPAPVSDDVVARGTVRIVNKYSKNQVLVKTTRLLTADNKLYRIDATVTVPAGSEMKVPVYADKPGREFVLTEPTKFTIPGLFVDIQKFIYAESDAAFEGVSRTAPTPVVKPKPVVAQLAPAKTTKNGQPVTQADIERAEKSLTDEIMDEAMKDLSSQVENRDSMDVVYVMNVVNKSNNATVGQVTDSFLSSMKLDVTAVYYSKDDMQALVRAKLKDRVPAGREFLPFTGGAVTYALESADAKAEIASIHVTADANYRLSPTSPLLQKSVIAGKSADEAKSLLSSIEGVESVDIVVHPSWMSGLPALKDRIKLDIQ